MRDKEKDRLRAAKYRESHREECREYQCQYRLKFPEMMRERNRLAQKLWRERHPGEKEEYLRQYKLKYPERFKERSRLASKRYRTRCKERERLEKQNG